jgi:tRNA-splicing ligase RtcB
MTRQPDPLQARARQLAVAAGLDPDGRQSDVNNARGRPIWTAYIDAARTEAKAAVAAASKVPGPIPQPPSYADAPLKIVGSHDQGTVDQMRNCMSYGNVVGGVIRADGHLGYAQPVGGVIAYERQISISGVGFDIGCGNMAARLDVPFAAIQGRLPEILADIRRSVDEHTCDICNGKGVLTRKLEES